MKKNGFDPKSPSNKLRSLEEFENNLLGDEEDEGEASIDDDDEDDNEQPAIVTYEQLTMTILQAINRSGLRFDSFQNLLNTNTLSREFKVVCGLTESLAIVSMNHPTVEISVDWEPENSLFSLQGQNALCGVYHDNEEWCSHQTQEPSLFADLVICYQVPDAAIESIQDDDDIDALARQLHGLFPPSKKNADPVDIHFEARYAKNELKLISASILNTIVLEDELTDVEILEDAAGEIAREIAANLKKLAATFPSHAPKKRVTH